jgi:hypothetical protein
MKKEGRKGGGRERAPAYASCCGTAAALKKKYSFTFGLHK